MPFFFNRPFCQSLISEEYQAIRLNWACIQAYLDRCSAELSCCCPGRVVNEQRLAVPEAPTAGVNPAAKCCDCCLCSCNVVIFAVIVRLIPAALVVVVVQVVVSSVAAALSWTHAGHGTQRASQLPPCPAAG